MDKDTLLNELLNALMILQDIKESNIAENKRIDAFMEKIAKMLEEEKKKKEKEEKEGEKSDEKSESKDAEEGDTEKKEQGSASGKESKKESDEKESSLSNPSEALSEKFREMMKEVGKMKLSGAMAGDSTSSMPPTPATTGGAGRLEKPVEHKVLEEGEELTDVEGGEASGGGVGLANVVPPGKVWCTTCNEYHNK